MSRFFFSKSHNPEGTWKVWIKKKKKSWETLKDKRPEQQLVGCIVRYVNSVEMGDLKD